MTSKYHEVNIINQEEFITWRISKNILKRLANGKDVESYEMEFLMDFLSKCKSIEGLTEDIELVLEHYLQEQDKIIFDKFSYYFELMSNKNIN